MKIEVETITPDKARSLLEVNTTNRPVSERTVRSYTQMMRDGKWILNGEGIKMCGGKLIDGQHRLHACVKSDRPFTTLIVFVDDNRAFSTLDNGKKRTGADILGIEGYKNTTHLAASASIVQKIYSGEMGDGSCGGISSSRILNQDIVDVVKGYGDQLIDSCRKGKQYDGKFRSKKACIAGLHYVFSMTCEGAGDYADSFMDSLHLGVNLTPDCPILHLRNAIIKMRDQGPNSVGRMRLTNLFLVKGAIQTWNNWLLGKKTQVLRVNRDPKLPKIHSPIHI